LRRECPETGFTRGMGEWEAPFTNAKIKMLGFEEAHDWRIHWTPEGGKEEEKVGAYGHVVERGRQAESGFFGDVSGSYK
jgi:hypothetical protein